MKRFINDLLRVNDPEKSGSDKYSLSRFLLLISSVLYIIAAIIGYFLLFVEDMSIDVEALNIITESLRWLIAIFAGYSFGGKFLSSVNGTPKLKES